MSTLLSLSLRQSGADGGFTYLRTVAADPGDRPGWGARLTTLLDAALEAVLGLARAATVIEMRSSTADPALVPLGCVLIFDPVDGSLSREGSPRLVGRNAA